MNGLIQKEKALEMDGALEDTTKMTEEELIEYDAEYGYFQNNEEN